MDGRSVLGDGRIAFGGHARGARLVDGRIVDFRVANHAHEKRSLLGQRLFSLAVEDFRDLVGLLLLQQLVGEVGYDLPCDISTTEAESKCNRH